MADTQERIRRLLRESAAAAHEEELRRALLNVAEAFKRWERRELGSGELSEIIHTFHQGPARDLWVAVAYAISSGVLAREMIPADLLDHLAGAIEFYRSERATS